MKLAFFSAKAFDKAFFEKANQSYRFHIDYIEAPLNENTAQAAQGYDGVCVFVSDVLNQNTIKQLARLKIKFIATRTAGFNHIDLKACHQHKISVVRVPEYSPHAVAEHAFALLLTLNRKTHKAYNRIRENNFSLNGLIGFDCFGKTVGVIGLGKIGQCFALIAKGFGMKVLAVDPSPNRDFAKKHSIQYVELNELLNKSDVISLHCPLLPATHHLINEQTIIKMKDRVTILNTGRGGLIDTSALINGLKQQKIGAVGLDVYEQESDVFFEDHSFEIIDDDLLMRLTTFPNVLITSHQGFFTHEAMSNIAAVTLANIADLKAGKACKNAL